MPGVRDTEEMQARITAALEAAAHSDTPAALVAAVEAALAAFVAVQSDGASSFSPGSVG